MTVAGRARAHPVGVAMVGGVDDRSSEAGDSAAVVAESSAPSIPFGVNDPPVGEP